jgi:Leucine-rich repeat (LRR) protein
MSVSKPMNQLIFSEVLEIINSNLTEIPDWIKNIKHFKSLMLKNSTFTDLDSWIQSIPELKYLYVIKCEFKKVNIELSNIAPLSHLKISNTKIKLNCSKKIQKNNLTKLEIINCDMPQLPDNFGDLSFLRFITLKKNNLSSLPNSIGNLKDLLTLDLEENNLDSLPSNFGKLENLGSLNLTKNPFYDLPSCIQDLSNLRELILEYLPFTHWPIALNTIHFERIDFWKSKLQSLTGITFSALIKFLPFLVEGLESIDLPILLKEQIISTHQKSISYKGPADENNPEFMAIFNNLWNTINNN